MKTDIASFWPRAFTQLTPAQACAAVSIEASQLIFLSCSAGERHRDNVLQAIGASLEAWVGQVKREKAVYHVLNMCSVDVTRKVLVAEAWCPVSAKPRVQEALREAAHTTSASVSALVLGSVDGKLDDLGLHSWTPLSMRSSTYGIRPCARPPHHLRLRKCPLA